MTNLTGNWVGWTCLGIFVAAYLVVIAEERLHLRKSVPMILAAGVIWLLIGVAAAGRGETEAATAAVRHTLLEYGELFLFLLAAITYVNTMEERQVFGVLRAWLLRRGFSLRSLFWVTGLFAFCISPVADNLTTTLVMGSVAIAVGAGHPSFITVACINIVVAANAGGVFSPFGDITTLMVWQAGHVSFPEFFTLLVPALVNWLVPASIMSFAVDSTRPAGSQQRAILQPGAVGVVVLFVSTIVFSVVLRTYLDLPPAIGMMTGLGALKLYSYVLDRQVAATGEGAPHHILGEFVPAPVSQQSFDIFKILERVEWDTLMFFYGVILCVGGIGTLGYLAILSGAMYGGLGATAANVLVGPVSAVIDNIPVMFAVLSMNPEMSHPQWLLVTLTTGVGGSLLSVGSAAGVALMGQARGIYTFRSHLKWSWAVALGYSASVGTHLLINGR